LVYINYEKFTKEVKNTCEKLNDVKYPDDNMILHLWYRYIEIPKSHLCVDYEDFGGKLVKTKEYVSYCPDVRTYIEDALKGKIFSMFSWK